ALGGAAVGDGRRGGGGARLGDHRDAAGDVRDRLLHHPAALLVRGRGELPGGATGDDSVDAAGDGVVDHPVQGGYVDLFVGVERKGQCGQDAAELARHGGLLVIGWRSAGPYLAYGGRAQQGGRSLGGRPCGGDGGLGVQGPEIVAGEQDAAARAGEG